MQASTLRCLGRFVSGADNSLRHYMFDEKNSRLAVGVTTDYHCFVVAIEGCESRSIRTNFDSQGADVGALQDIFQNLGCHTAVALDGGGSATIFVEGRPLLRPSDRHDVALLPRERLVPGMWAVDYIPGEKAFECEYIYSRV